MPIYEFACPKCRVIFNFFSQRVSPRKLPTCPKCGNKKMAKQMSNFALTKGIKESGGSAATEGGAGDEGPMPNLDDPKVMRAMQEMERDMTQLDENNPRHMARLMRKMKDLMPGAMPKEMETAIRRLEAGEDPEKIEADMGDIFGDLPGGTDGGGGNYSHDRGLYDY